MLSPRISAPVVADEILADDERLRQPLGPRLHGVSKRSPSCAPSPSSSRKRGRSSGVEMIRMSRIPASISVDSG